MADQNTPLTSIKSWPEDDRPREKLMNKGPEALSNSELLAILINSGSGKRTAVDLAKEILALGHNNLDELGKLSLAALQTIKGIGEARAITISAALELGRRRQQGSDNELRDINFMKSSQSVAQYLQTKLKDYDHEVFAVLYLNTANKVKKFEIISRGGMTGTVADPRIILKKALELNATALLISHNHPSGNLRPSQADISLTQKMKQAAAIMDIRLLDHIIVSTEGYMSFADEGIL